jgi:hypothetical protein
MSDWWEMSAVLTDLEYDEGEEDGGQESYEIGVATGWLSPFSAPVLSEMVDLCCHCHQPAGTDAALCADCDDHVCVLHQRHVGGAARCPICAQYAAHAPIRRTGAPQANVVRALWTWGSMHGALPDDMDPAAVGAIGESSALRVAGLASDWLVRAWLPCWLDAVSMHEHARALRSGADPSKILGLVEPQLEARCEGHAEFYPAELEAATGDARALSVSTAARAALDAVLVSEHDARCVAIRVLEVGVSAVAMAAVEGHDLEREREALRASAQALLSRMCLAVMGFHIAELRASQVRKIRRAIPRKLRWQILERDGRACVYCGRKAPEVKLEVDHITAVANGGTNDPSNLATACEDCNGGKSKTPLATPLEVDPT